MTPVDWNFAPSILIGVFILAAVYLIATGPLRRHIPGSQAVKPSRLVLFLLGIIVLFLGLVSPLDALSDEYLFTAHMVQHFLLTLAVPPLLLAGMPGWLVDGLLRSAGIQKIARFLTNPVVAFGFYNLVFSLWHIPNAYEAALENENIHIVEHLSFIITAVLFWWPIIGSTDQLPGLSYSKQILYLFLATIPCTVLGGVFVFAPQVIYPRYAEAPRFFASIDAMADQEIAGVIMAMTGMLVYLGFIGRAFYTWYNLESRQIARSSEN